ncbi:hypothetical protein CEXT_394141 [Caerostris extrusa]|uniref:Uncharacterized protein n=1 Tax=Caerostris extrusa TaxID=172846 RepID=A0AAV4QCH1_CAEEX|nr:hypothetical protein CEXT_394141 [Caerostris extrusa]
MNSRLARLNYFAPEPLKVSSSSHTTGFLCIFFLPFLPFVFFYVSLLLCLASDVLFFPLAITVRGESFFSPSASLNRTRCAPFDKLLESHRQALLSAEGLAQKKAVQLYRFRDFIYVGFVEIPEPDLHISALATSTSEKLPLSDERNCSDSENSNFHVSSELGSRKLGSLSPQSSLGDVQISAKKILPRKVKKLSRKKKAQTPEEKNE